MLKLFSHNKIYQAAGIEIKQSALHGRGVFAAGKFKPGAIIEIAPLILLEAADKEFLQTTSLFNYYFLIVNEDTPAALGLGNASIYNHSYTANAVYTVSLKDASLVIKAFKEIKSGDEITLNYNGKPDDTTHVYFQSEPI